MRFNEEMKVIKAIAEIFNDNENEKIPNNYQVICPANVCSIQAISDLGKRILLRFIDIESTRKNIEVDFKTKKGEIPSSSYSLEYLTKILAIFSYDEKVKITLKKDYPVMFENEDFKVILAPRIEAEDE